MILVTLDSDRKRHALEGNLRSSSITATLSSILALFTHVAACCASTSTAAGRVVSLALGIFHCLVIVVVPSVVGVADLRQLSVDVHILALQKGVDDLPNLLITGAEPAGVTGAGLRLRLEPEEVSLRGRAELKHKDAAVGLCCGLVGRSMGEEFAVHRNHDEVEIGRVHGGAALAPAEVDQICRWLDAGNGLFPCD